MNPLGTVILGIIQGLTEFLPVSSSGHLVLGENLLGLHSPGISLEIWLHFGTLVAVLVYFRRDLLRLLLSLAVFDRSRRTDRMLILTLIVATIPAAVIGLLIKKEVDAAFDSPRFVAAMLLVTGAFLLLTRWAVNRARRMTIGRGFVVGLAQAVAILPGISRSGSTIGCGMLLGIDPAAAARFSFLLSIPAIGGAFLLDMVESGTALFSSSELPGFLSGAAVAFLFGILSIHVLLGLMGRGKFFVFGIYCLVIGTVSLIFLP
jgi:undecaprenyl-diphosphatase